MKKLLLLLLIFISISSIGQKKSTKTPLKIISPPEKKISSEKDEIRKIEEDTLLVINKKTDEMDKSTSLRVSRNMICFEDDKSKGFFLSVEIKNDFSIPYLMLNSLNIGNCDEEGEILFLFDDDTNLKMISFAEFNCEGRSAYEITNNNIDIISSKKIKKIRYTNGRTGESYTKEIKITDKDYFIRIFKLAQLKKVIEQ